MTEDTERKLIVHIDPELQDLIPRYIENRREDVASILEALKQGEYDTIQRLGHSMKGSGGGYGFAAITDIGKSLEQAAKDTNAQEIQKQSSELKTYLDSVEVIYE